MWLYRVLVLFVSLTFPRINMKSHLSRVGANTSHLKRFPWRSGALGSNVNGMKAVQNIIALLMGPHIVYMRGPSPIDQIDLARDMVCYNLRHQDTNFKSIPGTGQTGKQSWHAPIDGIGMADVAAIGVAATASQVIFQETTCSELSFFLYDHGQKGIGGELRKSSAGSVRRGSAQRRRRFSQIG